MSARFAAKLIELNGSKGLDKEIAFTDLLPRPQTPGTGESLLLSWLCAGEQCRTEFPFVGALQVADVPTRPALRSFMLWGWNIVNGCRKYMQMGTVSIWLKELEFNATVDRWMMQDKVKLTMEFVEYWHVKCILLEESRRPWCRGTWTRKINGPPALSQRNYEPFLAFGY